MPITQYNSSVRQMSQSKFDSMKNASGKIPDLANQIVMTNSEDSNISCLRTEVVYDMTSSDANINWGYTSGITNNTTVTNKDFNKYKKLIVYAEIADSTNGIAEIDLMQKNGTGSQYNGNNLVMFGYETSTANYVFQCGGFVNSDKTSFTAVSKLRFIPTGATVTDSAYFVYRIEGVLKTPAMIYTGDELTAGNGINITNNIISSHNTHTVLWSGSKTDTGDITLSDDLSNYDLLIFTGLNSANEVCSFCVITSTISSYTDFNRPYNMGNNTYDINRYCNIYYKSQRTLSVKSIGNMTLKFVEGVR